MKITPKKILLVSWLTYASFYLIRVNLSVAIPGIMDQFGLTKTALGGVLSAFFLLYAIGQFLNGQLADNLGAKKLVAIGLAVSIIINFIVPSFGGLIPLLTILWGINGFFQAMGWSPNVKIVSSWFKKNYKGRAAGILGTSYIVGGALSWLLAGYLAKFSWRYVFIIPALLSLVVLVLWTKKAKENPEGKKEKANLKETIKTVLADKKVWLAGMGLFGLNIVRYGFLSWAPTYFFEVQGANITTATYKALVFPLAGALGALSTGWLCDKIFKAKRTSVGLMSSLVLAVSLIAFSATESWQFGLVLLALIGFTTFGPHSLLVSQLPMVLGNRKNTASITGFIDGMGYIGAALTGVITGLLVDRLTWSYAFYFWVLGAILAGVFIYLTGRKYNELKRI